MTTKERCLEMLKDNEFFQSALKQGKMICVTHDYEPYVIREDSILFDNQYNVVDASNKQFRIYDARFFRGEFGYWRTTKY